MVFGITVSKVCGVLIQLILYSPVPALRGKDYGKTRMNYPDYVQSQSGLQYKVCGQVFKKHSLLAKMKSFQQESCPLLLESYGLLCEQYSSFI